MVVLWACYFSMFYLLNIWNSFETKWHNKMVLKATWWPGNNKIFWEEKFGTKYILECDKWARFFRNSQIIKYRQYNLNRLKKTGSKFLNNQPFNVYLKNHHIIRTQIHYLRSKIIREKIKIIAHTRLLGTKRNLNFMQIFNNFSVFIW